MRVIAGFLKGRRLAPLPPNEDRVRPTSDRAREALFSILQKWPSGAFLDLCAGTGAVALEAHSRGYEPVAVVERDEPGWAILHRNLHGLPIQAFRKDVESLSLEAFKGQAVIFVDPPYEVAGALWAAMAVSQAHIAAARIAAKMTT